MNKLFCIILLLCIFGVYMHAQEEENMRYIQYIDADGKRQTVMSNQNSPIVVYRADKSGEVLIHYENGALHELSVYRSDSSPEALIVYNDTSLEELHSYRADGTLEAAIHYGDTAIARVAISDPKETQVLKDDKIQYIPIKEIVNTENMLICR